MKVFLSSTYMDLIEHRKAAHDALEKLGLHVIWMEAFGARPEDSTIACLKEVEESDLFVGIYAHRYGFIPDRQVISITEQEFDHAQKARKPIFSFLIKEDFSWPPEHIEHEQKEKIETFLKKVKKQPVDFFTTPDDLSSRVASSIGYYLNQKSKINIDSITSETKDNEFLKIDPKKLRKAIHKSYDRFEFERLLRDNNLSYYDLPEGPFENKIMYFIDSFQRRKKYDVLIRQILAEHPELISDLL